MQTQKPIIFFDGLCHLCNNFVDKIIQRDRKKQFQFASLQGETAKRMLSDEERFPVETITLLDQTKKYQRSDAVLRILIKLGGLYKVFALGYLAPPFLRDALYRWVARNRSAWFGQKDFCRLPKPEEKDRFLP